MQLITLPLMAAVCLSLWAIMNNSTLSEVEIKGENGVWDLRGFDFANEVACIMGEVAYIPNALLTPEEFAVRESEAQIGYPQRVSQYATSRIRLLLPDDDRTYMIMGNSIDFATRMYIDGEWVVDVGRPGDTKASTIPNTRELQLSVRAEDGVIEIVQQGSNFVHRSGGGHARYHIGYPEVLRTSYRYDMSLVVMGCFLALFLVHLTLFFILPSYRANLYFSLFCLTWFFRTGVTGATAFSTLLPGLSWALKFRMEYLSLPLTGLLVILMLYRIFPGVIKKRFRNIAFVLAAIYVILFLFCGTVFMSWVMLSCYIFEILGIALIVLCFIKRFRKPDMAQVVSLWGVAVFFYGGIRDTFYYNGILIPPLISTEFSQITMMIFVFLQMAAMFMGTLRAAEEARAMEQKLAAENAALDRVNRMKSDLIATISHETRTPLAVLSGYAELISRELRRKGVDEQTAGDLDRIADETQRIAHMMGEMQKLSQARDISTNQSHVQLADIIRQTAGLYEPVLARQGTTLLVDVPNDLPTVYASADELTQVLFNLFSNARDHTEKGRVIVTARLTNGSVSVEVSDNGAGISAEFLPHAFERGRHEKLEGSGLGLAICKEILQVHGGEISIISEKGKGTAVKFILPADGGEDDGTG